MVEVQVRFNNIDYPLKTLKKKMQREGIFKIMKEKKYYEKPSERKTRKLAESLRRKRKFIKKKYY